MLRTCFYMALVAIIFAVRSSEGAECATAAFTAEVNQTMLNITNIMIEDYATNTTSQILAKIKANIDPDVISLNMSVKIVNNTASLTYNLLFACNETIITYLPNGTQTVTVVTTSVDPNQVKNGVAAG